MRGGPAVGLVAVLLAHVPVPASAAATDVLVVRGVAPGYVDVRTTKPLELDLAEATYRGGGPYTGVLIDRIQPRSPLLDLLGIAHRTVGATSAGSVDVLGYDDGALPAGVYRIYLLGTGSSSVTIPVDGLGAARTVTTAVRFKPTYREMPLVAKLAPDADALFHGETATPVTLGSRPFVYQRAFVRFDGPVPQRYALTGCLRPSGDCAFEADLVGTGGSGGLGYAHAMLVDGEEARPGKYDVVARYRGSRAPDHARVGVLTAALTTTNPQVRFTLGTAPRAASRRDAVRPTTHSGHSAPSLPATGSAALPAILAAAPALAALRWHRATR